MKILSKWRGTMYGKIWHTPKKKLRDFLKKKCEELPRKQRMLLVAVLFGAFLLTAFFLFGSACYRIGLGKAQQRIQEIEHIKAVELSAPAETPPIPNLNDI